MGALPVINDQKLAIKIIDFDWSGRVADSPEYLLSLNYYQRYDWPKELGTIIKPGDDRIMVQNWWKYLFSEDFLQFS
jgi:hypothetical protein